MNKDENEKFDIMVGEPKEEVELGKNFEVKFCLYLYDKNEEPMKQASRVNDGTKATLKALITKNGNEFPDKTSEFTYHLGEIGNYRHTPEGKYIITANSQEEKKLLNRVNNINGKLIVERFGDKIGGDGQSLEESDDIKFKIESDEAAGRGIRVDIYNCPNNSPITAGQKPIQRIAGERIQIDLI
ncbi:16979_t:CDS:1 [Entrophospora sp. SA101]|nr:15292_t:CDS:1 [Entrophospora sp. SA101]CAJ0633922.1 2852_t:CDS:1 [Entrophospora sp. SA101]CAJ0761622.1 16979_t:CDS:1 [Entrophospora sp. SA101]CAJ0829124.1 7945_t:CDS:1 [Entrophospora sp. SA101]CAJ0898111.1 4689_t:CDS:1 [Entrophospora sp. SA101]